MNWSPFPFFRLAIFFVAGILIYEKLHFSLTFLVVSSVITSVIWLCAELLLKNVTQKKLWTGLGMLLLVFSLGMLLAYLKSENQIKSNKIFVNGENVYQGYIKEKLKVNPKPKFVVKAHVNSVDACHSSELILTFAESDSLAQTYEIGDEIIFRSKLKSINNQNNPDAFNYARFLKYKGINLNGFVKPEHHELVSRDNTNAIAEIALKASMYSERIIDENIDDKNVEGIAKALLTGNQTTIDQNIYKAYADTGAIHVLSVSGLHVAIFISLFVFLFDKIKNKSLTFTLIKVSSLLCVVWFYVVLTGMSPSVVRAGVMVSLYLLGKNLFKGVNSYNIISIAAIIMLIYNPYYVFQTSFQFSYISLLSILYFQPKISKWLKFENKILEFIWDLVVVSLSAQILMFPFTIYNFHQFPNTFALSGIVAVPLVTIIIYMGTLMVLIAPISATLSLYLGMFIEFIIKFLNNVIVWLSKLPYALVDNIWINSFSLFLMVLSIACWVYWHEIRTKASLYLSMSFLFLVFCINSYEKIIAGSQQGFTIYNMYNNDIVDIFKGHKVSRFIKNEDPLLNSDLITKNHLIRCRTEVITTTQSKIHAFDDKTLLILSTKDDLYRLSSKELYDHVYVTINEPPENFAGSVHAGKFILSPTLKPWIIKKWLLLQDQSDIPVYDIKKRGSFVFRM